MSASAQAAMRPRLEWASQCFAVEKFSKKPNRLVTRQAGVRDQRLGQ
jgi:hypothetical protein